MSEINSSKEQEREIDSNFQKNLFTQYEIWRLISFMKTGIAQSLIDGNDVRNKNFMENPDSYEEHDIKRHQYGIISHTQKFMEVFRDEVVDILKKWGIFDKVSEHLLEQVELTNKLRLLQYAIYLHDIGKFKRSFKNIKGENLKEVDGLNEEYIEKNPGQLKSGLFKPDYSDHEKIGADLVTIYDSQVDRLLRYLENLQEKDIEYVKKCVGLHFELGKIRMKVKGTKDGYSLKYLNSDQFVNDIKEIILYNRGFEIEIGLLFLFDSISRTDFNTVVKNKIASVLVMTKIQNDLKKNNIDVSLMEIIKQHPINVELVRRYFEILFSMDICLDETMTDSSYIRILKEKKKSEMSQSADSENYK